MNNPNPFVPQGSLLEQNKRRSRMKLAVFCVLAVGISGLTAMLLQGCNNKNNDADNTSITDTNPPAITDTNPPSMNSSNPMAYIPPVTNPIVVPQPVPEAATTEYTVVAHDNLGKIAKKFGVTLKALEDANPGVVPTKLKVNQKLVIPAATSGAAATATPDATTSASDEQTYTVISGDKLVNIAKKFGVTIKAIEAANPGLDPNHIKVSQKLKIPAKADVTKADGAASAPAPVVPVISPAPAAPMSTTQPAH